MVDWTNFLDKSGNSLTSSYSLPDHLKKDLNEDYSVENKDLSDFSVGEDNIQSGAVTNAKIKNISADKITTSTLTARVNVGSGNVKIDGINKNIIINDGTRDIILIGYQQGGF